MLETLSILAAAALLTLSFGLLALSQERHWDTVARSPGPTPARRCWQRRIATASIVAALPLCILSAGSGFGVLLWAFPCFAAAFAVSLVLTWWPRGLQPLAMGSPRFSHKG